MRNVDLDRAMRQLAELQHSVVSRSQARGLGASRAALDRRQASGEWEAASAHVLRIVGSRRSFRQRCMIAVLHYGDGAVISGVSAARLWGLPGFSSSLIEVGRPRACAMRQHLGFAAVFHRPRLLPAHHCTVVDGIPVSTVARTLFDLAASQHPRRVERALDNALTRRLVGIETMRAVTIELLEHGRTGSALMRRLLMDRGAGYIPPASGLEARFLQVLARAGVEAPVSQVDLGDEGWVGRVDHYFRPWRLVVEIDSALHHSSKLDRESDARRDAALRAAGFEVLRFTDEQVWEHPDEVVAEVRIAIARLRSGSESAPVTGALSLPER